MTEEKTCHNCGNKNCNVYYSIVKKDCKRHYETYGYRDFDCVNHDKWEELKVEEIRTDNTETLKNALERIKELEKENAELEAQIEKMKCCLKCEHWYYYKSFCDKDNSYHSEGQSCEHFTLRR